MATKREDETQTAFAVRVMKEQGAKDALAELRERMVIVVGDIDVEFAEASADQRRWLAAQLSGVRLAMSCLDEIVRGLS